MHEGTTDSLHREVYGVLIALAAWFALAVWSFAGRGVTDYLLFIVSGFVFVAVALPHPFPGRSRRDGAWGRGEGTIPAGLGGVELRDLDGAA